MILVNVGYMHIKRLYSIYIYSHILISIHPTAWCGQTTVLADKVYFPMGFPIDTSGLGVRQMLPSVLTVSIASPDGSAPFQ